MKRAILLFPAVAILAACQTTKTDESKWDVPLTLQTVGPAYADYVVETADVNKDFKVTRAEWVTAGGTEGSFASIDEDKDGVVTRAEVIRVSSNTQFLDFTRRYADVNQNVQLTPRHFRSPAGVRLLRHEF